MPSHRTELLGDAADTDDVVRVLTGRIEQRFEMSMGELAAAVAASPQAHPAATEIVHWHRLLTESQSDLERAEDELLAQLATQPNEIDDPTMALAHRVNEAVTVRDGRAMTVRFLLDPDEALRARFAARGAHRDTARVRRGPAVNTSPATAVASAPAALRGGVR
ncbi:hypothetical protein [Streptomyces fragilis]|uniref:DUF222 domain-containing protein n=1 Tax=Streptomyces fragilis TaxID=67301 RepID=A0ABV2YCA8_9ACTN|nr:hypothetical protein [Streptomyces fragilis]